MNDISASRKVTDMSYEYSSDQAQLDFPNPYRVENMLWAARAGILLVCAAC